MIFFEFPTTACAAGYTGDGTTCTACAADTFLTSWVSGKACDACATGFSTGGATAQTTCTGIGERPNSYLVKVIRIAVSCGYDT